MDNDLRFNIGEKRIDYNGHREELDFDEDRIIEFNHRHKHVLHNYDISLESCKIYTLFDKVSFRSNLGALSNRQVRQSVVLSAALSAVAVCIDGRASAKNYSEDKLTREVKESLKRYNDRTAAQVMAEVLQTTAESLPMGEEILIESTITEGVRIKPGKEAGGNPTIAVGAVFGKDEHRARYGLSMPRNVTLFSMGNDVIDGTTKSIMGDHSSLTALFVTESGVKRHLPDIYVQRWMAGVNFDEFNPREVGLLEIAELISNSYGYSGVDKLSSFFLDRKRHHVAMDELNEANISTPYDKDGDLIPAVLLGLQGLTLSNGRGLDSMIGEIGGSAEWAVGVLPLVWRGGQAIGMLTSQSSLTRKDLTPEQLWKERFHYTEEEFMLMQDARFERKPYFTIHDLLEDPYAGGISAFGAITDNYFIPTLEGVNIDREKEKITVNTLVVNSLGMVESWRMVFKANNNLKKSFGLIASPKKELEELSGKELEDAIARMLSSEKTRKRYNIFFNNEYYPALIPVRDKMVMLHKALQGLIDRGALNEKDRQITEITERMAGDWFINSD